MSNFLEKNQKTSIRFSNGEDIVLYEPTKDQYNVLKEKINKLSIKKESNSIIIGEDMIREIFKTLVKDGQFIDNYNSKELNKLIEDGNYNIKVLFREIQSLLQEITDDIQHENNQLIKDMNRVLNILISNDDMTTMKGKFNKLLKKNKIALTYDQISELQHNPEEIINLIKNKIN